MAKYGKGQSTDDLGLAVEMLFERNLMPRLPPQAQLVTNDFRTERLYTEEVCGVHMNRAAAACHPPTHLLFCDSTATVHQCSRLLAEACVWR